MIIFSVVILAMALCSSGLAFYLAEIERREMVARRQLLIDGLKAVALEQEK